MSQAETPAPTIGRGDGVRLAVATAVSGAAAFLVQIGVARLIPSEDDVAVFLTFWSAMFIVFGLMSGISVETTRATSSARRLAQPPGPKVWWVGLVVGVGLGGLLAASAPLWGPAVFPRSGTALALVVAAAALGYAFHAVTSGALVGLHHWRTYSTLIVADSVLRLVLVLVVAALGGTLLGPAAGAALAAFTWLGFVLFSSSTRAAVMSRADVPTRTYARRLGAASLANGASALIAVGFPTLLAVTTSHAEFVTATPLLFAITLTRAPLMIPLNAFQGVAVSHVVGNQEQGLRAIARFLWIIVGVGLVGALLAWWIGPFLMQLVFGPAYRVAGPVLAGLMVATVGLAVLTLTGAVCQALTRHRAFVSGWLVAAAVATSLLLLPGSLEFRSILSLLVGPLAGIAVHLLALRRGRTPDSAPQENRHG